MDTWRKIDNPILFRNNLSRFFAESVLNYTCTLKK